MTVHPLRDQKIALRRAMIRARDGLDPGDRSRACARLLGHLRDWPPWREARGVAAFVAIGSEVDLGPLLREQLEGGRRLWLPRTASRRELCFHEVPDAGALERGLVPGPFGLREPPASWPAAASLGPSASIDLVLVPGLAFGARGERLGYGAGYYDRALADAAESGRALTCAVAFDRQVEPPEGPVPVGPTDVAVDYLATESGVSPGGVGSA